MKQATKSLLPYFLLLIIGSSLLLGAIYPSEGGRFNNAFDRISFGLIEVTHAHHEIHEGYSFTTSDFATVNDAGTREFLIETGAKYCHITFDITGTLETTIAAYENASSRTAGTAMTEHNRNRNSSNTATAVVTHTPGGSGTGTLIFTTKFGLDTGPAGKSGTGGAARGTSEWVLKPNLKYYLLITSGTDGNTISTQLDWYEETYN